MNDPYLTSQLGDNERILLIARQHWFVLLRSIVAELLFAIAIVVLVTVAQTFWLPEVPLGWGYILLILPIASLLRDVLIFMRKTYVITNLRVLQISGVVSKRVTDSSLTKINDVNLRQSFFGRIFDFGDIEILTASEIGLDKLQTIQDPLGFKRTMLNAKVALEEAFEDNDRPHDSIPDMIAKLDVLRQRGVITDAEFQLKKQELLRKM